MNGPFRPRTSGNAFSSGQNTSSITISPVIEARRPTLPWIAGADRPFDALFQDEAADRALVVLGPDDEHVGDRRIGDPHLARRSGCSRRCTFFARVTIEPGSEPWFGSVRPKQPIHSPVASFGRYFCFARFGAELVDRHHHQRGLHAHHRAVAGVDALDFARDQAVADVVEARAAVLLAGWSGRAGPVRPSRGRSPGRSSRGGRLRARAAPACPGSSRARRRAPCARLR